MEQSRHGKTFKKYPDTLNAFYAKHNAPHENEAEKGNSASRTDTP